MEGKNATLPGVEFPKNEALSLALADLRAHRRSRMDALKKECEAQDKVLALMHDAKLTVYVDGDYDPPLEGKIVTGKEKIKIKLGRGDDEDNGED